MWCARLFGAGLALSLVLSAVPWASAQTRGQERREDRREERRPVEAPPPAPQPPAVRPEADRPVETPREPSTRGLERATQILGSRVFIDNNFGVGRVEDILLNPDGDADYLVVLNQDRYVLVPWNAARVDYPNRTVSVQITRQRFEEVPTFTRNDWPNFSDTRYFQRIQTYYPAAPGRERRIERREDRRGGS